MSTTAAGTITGKVTLQDYIAAVLAKLNLPATGPNIAVLSGLALSEGRGLAGWNPFDTTQKAPGSTAFNSAGVQNYSSFQQGVDATAQTLNNGLYDSLLTGLAEQQPLSYYVSGPGFTSLKIWQRGPKGPSNPPPAAVNVLASRTVAQLLAYAKLVTSSNNAPAPAGTSVQLTSSKSGSDPCAGLTGWQAAWCQLTQFPANVAATSDPIAAAGAIAGEAKQLLLQGFFVIVGLVLFVIGLTLIFGGDIENLVEKAGDKIPAIPVVP